MKINISINLEGATAEEISAKILLAAQRFGWKEQIPNPENEEELIPNPESFIDCFGRSIAQYGMDNAKIQAKENAEEIIKDTKNVEIEIAKQAIEADYQTITFE